MELMIGICQCRRWLNLERRKKQRGTTSPPNAKIIGRNADSFPAIPAMRNAKIKKTIRSNASERMCKKTRTADLLADREEFQYFSLQPQQTRACVQLAGNRENSGLNLLGFDTQVCVPKTPSGLIW